MKKLLAAVAASLLMASASAQTVPAPSIAAKSWLLLDATSGQIIAAQDPNARVEPASLTKVMTAYVTFAALRDKRLTLDTILIHGELDDTILLQDVFEWARPLDIPVTVIPGADHFFHRKLGHIKNLVVEMWRRDI